MSEHLCQPECHCRHKVLVVDDDPEYRKDHIRNLQGWGYQPVFAEGNGIELMEDAKVKAKREQCYIALVDMRLLDDENRFDESGLHLAQELLPTRSIIVTGYASVTKYREAQENYNVFGFVGKEEGPQPIQMLLQKALSRHCRYLSQIRPENRLTHLVSQIKPAKPDGTPIAVDEAREVLTALFPDAKDIYLEQLFKLMKSSSSDIRKRSVVFKATEQGKQPVIVKFVTTNWNSNGEDLIEKEVANYHKHVEGKLGGNIYPDLKNYVRLWNLGGIVYSLTSSEVKTFTEYYTQTEDVAKIVRPLQKLFSTILQPIHNRIKQSNFSIFELYENKRNAKLRQNFPTWAKLPNTYQLPDVEGNFLDPRPWLTRQYDKSQLSNFVTSITHGDIHGDNLFIDNNNQAWVIDFEQTGEGHVLSDYISLEVDIIFRLTSSTAIDLNIFYEFCVGLTQSTQPYEKLEIPRRIVAFSELYKAFQVIQQLRVFAIRNVEYEDQREYHWGLLLNILQFYNENAFDISQHALLFASLLCQRLDEWNESLWPPKSWPQVEWRTDDDLRNIRSYRRRLTMINSQLKGYRDHPPEHLVESQKLLIEALSEFGEVP